MRDKILCSILIIVFICNIFNNGVLATEETTDYSNLPSSYDLRNDIDINVENQENRNWCNAFTTTKTIETYLQKVRGINYNLSEAYMAYAEAPYFGGFQALKKDINTVNHYGIDGGNGKFVSESDFPNKDYDFNETNKQYFDNAPVLIKSYRSENLSRKSKDELKDYIINNGAIDLTMCIDEQWYNSSTSSIYCPNYIPLTPTNDEEQANEEAERLKIHTVVIIGWDDNYSKNNFKSSNRPQNNGAWLVLNSWGNDWGNNGTAWISYEDAYVVNDVKYGIESVTLTGELNANFRYNIIDDGNYGVNVVQAYIEVDDDIEDVEGWNISQYGNKIITKKFTEEFEPYTIELVSKTDGAKTSVEIKIPVKWAEYQYLSESEQIRNLTLMIICPFAIIILIIVLYYIVKKMKQEKKTDNMFYKIISGIGKLFKIIFITALVLGLIALIVFIVAFFIM